MVEPHYLMSSMFNIYSENRKRINAEKPLLILHISQETCWCSKLKTRQRILRLHQNICILTCLFKHFLCFYIIFIKCVSVHRSETFFWTELSFTHTNTTEFLLLFHKYFSEYHHNIYQTIKTDQIFLASTSSHSPPLMMILHLHHQARQNPRNSN